MDISSHPSVKSLRFNRRVTYILIMANALLVGFSQKFANTSTSMNLTLKSISFGNAEITVSNSSASTNCYSAYKSFESPAKMLYVYCSKYPYITTPLTDSDHIYTPPSILIPASTMVRHLIVNTNTNSERRTSTNNLEFTSTSCRIHGYRYNTDFRSITYYGDIVILYGF